MSASPGQSFCLAEQRTRSCQIQMKDPADLCSSPLSPLTATIYDMKDNSTVFSPHPTIDVDHAGRKRFVG